MSTYSYTKATKTFLDSAEAWLSDEDAPAVASLQAMAAALDEELVPSLASAYERAYRALLKRKPTGPTKGNPLAEALAKLADDAKNAEEADDE